MNTAKEDSNQDTHHSTALCLPAEVMQDLLLSINTMLYARDIARRLTFVSNGVVAHLGYDRSLLIAKPEFWESHIHAEDLTRVAAQWDTLRQNQYAVCVYRMLRKDGTYRWLRDEAQVIRAADGSPLHIVGYLTDITEYKSSEALLAQQVTERAWAQRLAGVGTWDWDVESDTVSWSEEMHRMFGIQPGKFGGTAQAFLRFVHPDDVDRIRQAIDASRNGASVFNCEFRIVKQDGTERYLLSHGEIRESSAGCLVRMFGTAQDITQRRQAENALRQSETRLATFMDNLPGAAVIRDQDGRFLYANTTAAAGYHNPGQWEGMTIEQVFPSAVAAQLRANDLEVLRTGKILRTVETTQRQNDVRHWLVSKFPLPDLGGNAQLVGAVGIDITDQKRIEEELRSSELKLRCGLQDRERLCQDLHDTVIQALYAAGMSIEECQRLIKDGNDCAAIKLASAAVNTLNQTIRELRQFITKGKLPIVSGAELAHALSELARRIEAAQTLRVKVNVDLDAAHGLTSEQAHHIECIAREVMSNTLRHAKATEQTISLRDSGRYLRFEAIDNGRGFNIPKVIASGQGLHNITSRARALAARLRITSRPACGTKVVLDLPKETP